MESALKLGVELPQKFAQRTRAVADRSLDVQSQFRERLVVFYHLEQRVVSEALSSPPFAQNTAPTLALDLEGDMASRIAQDDGRNIVSIPLLVGYRLHFPE